MNSIQTSVNDLLSRQPKEWKLFKDNLDALNGVQTKRYQICLLYTSDAADE